MPARRFTDEQEQEIAQRYLAGESLRAIGASLGVTHHVLTASLRRQNQEQRTAPERNRIYSINGTVFDTIDSEQKAYWLGFLFADGHVSRRTLSIGLAAADGPHLSRLAELLESDAPIVDRLNNGYPTATVAFTDEHMTVRLQELGIKTRRPDPLITFNSIPDHLQSHWIRGYFDGDGTIKLKAVAEFCGPHILLECLRETLAPEVGRSGSLYPHVKSKVWYLAYAGRPSCLALAEYLYRDATIFLERKRHRFNALPAPAARWWERPRDNGRWRHNETT